MKIHHDGTTFVINFVHRWHKIANAVHQHKNSINIYFSPFIRSPLRQRLINLHTHPNLMRKNYLTGKLLGEFSPSSSLLNLCKFLSNPHQPLLISQLL